MVQIHFLERLEETIPVSRVRSAASGCWRFLQEERRRLDKGLNSVISEINMVLKLETMIVPASREQLKFLWKILLLLLKKFSILGKKVGKHTSILLSS